MSCTLRPIAKCGNAQHVALPTVQALEMTRVRLGLSRAGLSRRVKVTNRTVTNWLSGKHPIAVETLCNDAEIAMVFSALLTAILADQLRRAA
jgi:transcriptional regulator with XRE-family HTH domain